MASLEKGDLRVDILYDRYNGDEIINVYEKEKLIIRSYYNPVNNIERMKVLIENDTIVFQFKQPITFNGYNLYAESRVSFHKTKGRMPSEDIKKLLGKELGIFIEKTDYYVTRVECELTKVLKSQILK